MAGSESIGAVILAAGYSSRFGRPKALLPIGGGTVLERIVGACSDSGVDPIHLVIGHRGGMVSAAARHLPVHTVWNDRYPRGQTSSLQAGLRSLPEGLAAVVISPVDYPLVTSGVVTALIDAFRSAPSREKVFIPSHAGRRGHPYLLRTSVLAEFHSLAPDTPGRTVVLGDPDRIRYVVVENDGVLIDLDEPPDYLLARSRLRRSQSPF